MWRGVFAPYSLMPKPMCLVFDYGTKGTTTQHPHITHSFVAHGLAVTFGRTASMPWVLCTRATESWRDICQRWTWSNGISWHHVGKYFLPDRQIWRRGRPLMALGRQILPQPSTSRYTSGVPDRRTRLRTQRHGAITPGACNGPGLPPPI